MVQNLAGECQIPVDRGSNGPVAGHSIPFMDERDCDLSFQTYRFPSSGPTSPVLSALTWSMSGLDCYISATYLGIAGEMLFVYEGWTKFVQIGYGPGPAHKDPNTSGLIMAVGN